MFQFSKFFFLWSIFKTTEMTSNVVNSAYVSALCLRYSITLTTFHHAHTSRSDYTYEYEAIMTVCFIAFRVNMLVLVNILFQFAVKRVRSLWMHLTNYKWMILTPFLELFCTPLHSTPLLSTPLCCAKLCCYVWFLKIVH